MAWHAWLPPADRRLGAIATLLSIGFFNSLDRLLSGFVPPYEVASKGPNQIMKWRNLVVSWIHALLVGSWDILCFYYYPSLMDDLANHVVPYTYYMVSMSTGYFLFDFWIMYSQKQVFQSWELSMHHFAVLSTFIYNLLTVKYIAYTVVALLAEVNSFFLHSRKLLRMRGISSSSSIYRLNAALNLITFACCRGYCLYRVTYGIYVESDKLSTFYLTILCLSMLIMNLINPMLFWILLRNDFLRVPTSSTRVSHTTSRKVQRAVSPPSSMDRSGGSVTFEQLHDKSAGNGMVLSEVGFT